MEQTIIAKGEKVQRNANIELFRILLMLVIIAHHYLGGGVSALFDFDNPGANMIFLQIVGYGGQTAINCFVLISGYFMCQQKFSFKRLFKLYFLVKFYTVIFYLIFSLTGYYDFNWRESFELIFNVAYGITGSWLGGYLALFLLAPFINILIKNLSRNRHLLMIAILFFIYTITSTFFLNPNYEYLGWYITLYLVASFIRLYPCNLFRNKRLFGILSLLLIVLSWLSIIALDFIGAKTGLFIGEAGYMLQDSNKLLAALISFALFLFVLNVRIEKGQTIKSLINRIAQSTLGVLLLHANSDAMRDFLWKDVFKNSQFYDSQYLIPHLFITVGLIYTICVAIDQLRIVLIERPVLAWLETKEVGIKHKYQKVKQGILDKVDKILQ